MRQTNAGQLELRGYRAGYVRGLEDMRGTEAETRDGSQMAREMLKLTKRQLYDYREPTRGEKLLTGAIHHLWYLRRKSRGTDMQDDALETLFEAKRKVKAEIKAKSAESFKKWVQEVGTRPGTIRQ